MAELLIRARDGTNRKMGDICDIHPKGMQWGSKQQPPYYVHLEIEDATRDDLKWAVESWEKERIWRVDYDFIKSILRAGGRGRMTKSRLNEILIDKRK